MARRVPNTDRLETSSELRLAYEIVKGPAVCLTRIDWKLFEGTLIILNRQFGPPCA